MARFSTVCLLFALLVGVISAHPLLSTPKPIEPSTEPPTEPHNEPPTEPPTQASTDPPTQPPTKEPTTKPAPINAPSDAPTTESPTPEPSTRSPTTTQSPQPVPPYPFPYEYRIITFNALHEEEQSNASRSTVFSCNRHRAGDFLVEEANFPDVFKTVGFMLIKDSGIYPLGDRVSFISVNRFVLPNFSDIDILVGGRPDNIDDVISPYVNVTRN